jgi:hypothetical protein
MRRPLTLPRLACGSFGRMTECANCHALYVRDDALRVRMAPHLGSARFAKILAELEACGFPRRDPIFDGRYWPAVRAWLDHRHGVDDVAAPMAPDGRETW